MSPGNLHRAALLAFFACACASEPTEPKAAGAGGDGAGGVTGEAGAPPITPRRCEEGSFPGTTTEPIAVGTVSGQVVDENGEPTSAGLVQVCGKDICINARVGDDGKLAEQVEQQMDAPACKIGDGLTWAKLAFSIGEGDSDLGTLTTARLPAFADGVAFAPGARLSSGGVTLELGSDARVEVDTLTYEDEGEQTFRAVALPASALALQGADFVAGFGLAPVETRICPRPALELANDTELEPGTQLELYAQGFDVLEDFTPYGGWLKVSDGVVSDDGATLDFAEGPDVLTALAVKVKAR